MDTSTITIKIDKKLKERFLEVCKAEGLDLSQCLRELMVEAISRDYINQDRKRIFQAVISKNKE